ncbi:MAG: hypothetical protein HRU07_05700 [Nitrosopumilus sp.]|nr:hypothetical protein [Nitrosopumilus sp.]NRA05640.1 hypothetical protein [Nitrosopumilus sp.]
MSELTFEDGVWAVIENFYGYDFNIEMIIKEFKITKEQAIQYSKKTGFRPEIINEINEKVWCTNAS